MGELSWFLPFRMLVHTNVDPEKSNKNQVRDKKKNDLPSA